MTDRTKSMQEAADHLRPLLTDMLKPLADKYPGSRSRVDAIRLKCLECCCGQMAEVRKCDVKACPLWVWRPYQ